MLTGIRVVGGSTLKRISSMWLRGIAHLTAPIAMKHMLFLLYLNSNECNVKGSLPYPEAKGHQRHRLLSLTWTKSRIENEFTVHQEG